MSESYELKPINVPTFSNLERGGTSESKLEKEDDYDYNHDLAILKAIYHYYFNHGVIPHPPYSKNFIDYIEASVPNMKFRGQALVNKIVMLEHYFLKVMKMAARSTTYNSTIPWAIWNPSLTQRQPEFAATTGVSISNTPRGTRPAYGPSWGHNKSLSSKQGKRRDCPSDLKFATEMPFNMPPRYGDRLTVIYTVMWCNHGTITREPMASTSQPMDNNATNVILAYLDTMSRDLAMANERSQVGIVAALPTVEVLESPFFYTLSIVRSHENQTLVVDRQALVDPLDDEIDSPRENDLCPSSASIYNLTKVPLPNDESIHTLVDPCKNQGGPTLVYELPTTS
ncbi:hypothetical protein BC332_19367 [Capsicum chinense]|nr:hypothetical protein BC332_19367 [Capsicum chinense]